MDRAFGLLHVKAFDAERRVFSGLASTPDLDRQGQSVDPMGVTYRNPVPLLFHHDQKQPVGTAILSTTADGIAFEATLPTVTTPGRLKDRVDEAWHTIENRLITGVSVGLLVQEKSVQAIKGGGYRLTKTEIVELSLVTIPANTQATILAVKSLAASGPDPSRAGDLHPIVRVTKGTLPMTTTEQITALENKRAAHVGRMNDIQTTCATDGRSKDDAERTEFSTLQVEVKTIDAELVDAREMERLNIAQAKPVVAPALAMKTTSVISVQPNVAPGSAFVRLACAKLVCNGNLFEAAEYAKRWNDSTPEVALALKAAVAPGTTTDATWALPLVNQGIANEFIELLRPATILGKIPGLRMVPFNVKVPSQTAGGSYGWVGESKPKPVTKLAFSSVSLGVAKAAGIIVLTEELVRLSNPSAEALVRADMVAGIAQFLDAQFIDPAVAAVANVNPASITNGAPTAAATASPLADILGLIQHFVTNNISPAGVTFIMSAANALSLSFRTNLDGSPQFPGIGIEGGAYRGLTFITSQAAGANIVALQPNLILYADDGGVTIDASREASLQMDSAPASPADATTVFVSLWQTNTVGLRAERYVNWNKANANAVKYLTAANYPAPAGTTTTRALDEAPPRSK
jgi:HK97 family phage major capsid protein/HK97 family phage prohead protease